MRERGGRRETAETRDSMQLTQERMQEDGKTLLLFITVLLSPVPRVFVLSSSQASLQKQFQELRKVPAAVTPQEPF